MRSCSVEFQTSCSVVWQSASPRGSLSPDPELKDHRHLQNLMLMLIANHEVGQDWIRSISPVSSRLLCLPFPSRLASLCLSWFLESSPSLPFFLRHSSSRKRATGKSLERLARKAEDSRHPTSTENGEQIQSGYS